MSRPRRIDRFVSSTSKGSQESNSSYDALQVLSHELYLKLVKSLSSTHSSIESYLSETPLIHFIQYSMYLSIDSSIHPSIHPDPVYLLCNKPKTVITIIVVFYRAVILG